MKANSLIKFIIVLRTTEGKNVQWKTMGTLFGYL